MVVQCPSCQSRFRVADEKVTERGVRVRCTVCKNVFPVKKGAGAAEGDTSAKRPSTGPISTKQPGDSKRLDIDDLFGADELVGDSTGPVGSGGARPKTGPVSKPTTGPVSKPTTGPVSKAGTGPISKPSTGPLSRPATGPIGGPKPATGPISRPGTGPISRPVTGPVSVAKPATGPISTSRPPTGPISKAGTGPIGAKAARPAGSKPSTGPVRPRAGADDLDLDFDLGPDLRASSDEGTGAGASRGEPPAAASNDPFDALSPAGKDLFDSPPPAPRKEPIESPAPAKKEAAAKSAADSPAASARPAGDAAREAKKEPRYRSIFRNPADLPRSTKRELISSALTGLVGASLAVVVMFVAALSDEHAGGWLGYGTRDDLVATRIASGVYDTAAGRPVLFVRGRVENRGKTARSVRVVAELVGDSGVAAKAVALAGAEPGPEDVYALSSPADAEKLMQSLNAAASDRTLAPGKSLPFFAVLADAPQDLQGQKLHVRFETVEAAPRQRSAQRAR